MKKVVMLALALGWTTLWTFAETPVTIKGPQGQALDINGEIQQIEQDAKMFDDALGKASGMVEKVDISLDYYRLELGQGPQQKTFAQKAKEALGIKTAPAKLPVGILDFNTIKGQYTSILDNLFKNDEIIRKIVAEKTRLKQLSYDAATPPNLKDRITALMTKLQTLSTQFDKLSKDWARLRNDIVTIDQIKQKESR